MHLDAQELALVPAESGCCLLSFGTVKNRVRRFCRSRPTTRSKNSGAPEKTSNKQPSSQAHIHCTITSLPQQQQEPQVRMNAHCDQASTYGSTHQSNDACACECSTLDPSDSDIPSNTANVNNSTLLSPPSSALHPATHHPHDPHQDTPAMIYLATIQPTSAHTLFLAETPQIFHQQFFAEPAEAETVTHSDSLLQSLLDAVEGVDSSDALNRLVAMALLVASARVDVTVVHAGNVPPAAD
ncbi:hypothetical protein BJ741DRAFT_175568 [Chytriomyces cf. hyalinus JEL632]|nr:hypothetical protein BJ741DRAFT_175568 [Chytriomyces cf. hyalinus JEL632]